MPFLRTLLFIVIALPAFGNRGAEIYTEHCASCHGDKGQGVAKEYDEALVGKKSIMSLAKYIHRTMPEDDEDAVIDEDARLVAEYIHGAFYSPEAHGKLKPVRRDMLRLTQHQHRRALADIVANFRWRPNLGENNGLSAEYFNKEKMDDRKGKLAKRIDQKSPSTSPAITVWKESTQKASPSSGADPFSRRKPAPTNSASKPPTEPASGSIMPTATTNRPSTAGSPQETPCGN